MCQTARRARSEHAAAEVSVPLLSRCVRIFELRRPWGLSGLCLSCFCGHVRLVEYFLRHGVNVNETDKPSATDNYFASLDASHEHKLKMREMHSRVAQDMGMFYYPLHIAVQQDSVDLVQLLLRYKDRFDVRDEGTLHEENGSSHRG